MVLCQKYNIDALIFTLLQQLLFSPKWTFFTVMWSLWKRRNMKLWQQQNKMSAQVIQRATHLLDEWWAAQCIMSRSAGSSTTVQNGSTSRDETKWTKSTIDRYKCNIYASFSSSLNMVGLGMCIRNDVGEFVLAKTAWFAPLCDVDVEEVVSPHTTLECVSDLNSIQQRRFCPWFKKVRWSS